MIYYFIFHILINIYTHNSFFIREVAKEEEEDINSMLTFVIIIIKEPN